MKIRIMNKLLFALVFIFGINLSAQERVIVTLNVFQPLPEVSFAAFLTNPFLESTPRILQVIMVPQDRMVIVQGSILWRKVDESSFNELLSYTTKPFTSRNFYNDDFSSIDGIEIEESNSNEDLLQENLRQGKPTGTYKIIIKVFDSNMEFQSDATEDLDFLNPAQTLSIIQPSAEDQLDVAGILLTWTDVLGVADFIVKANIRSSKLESLEEALQKGNPIVDNASVGTKTSVNLREILDRELVGGEEIVVQVRGVVPGPGGPTIIYSDIINFYLNSSGSPVVDKGVEDFETLIITVIDDMKQQGEGESEAAERLQNLLSDLQNGNINFNDIRIKFEGGRQLTYAEFQEILDYLRRNPDVLTNLLYEAN
ncbi:MAG: hypothetical protein L3J41_13735 [Melioribacteraceae bacterium]|nr:hypothetical protein [Melioribacteraceae bacterium]